MQNREPLTLPTDNESVILRELATPEDDLAYFNAVQANPDHFRQFDDNTADKYQTLAKVTEARLNHGARMRMGIWADGTFVGTVNARPDGMGRIEIGYWTHPDHQGRGYATLAAYALARYASGLNRYSEIYALVVEGNTRSMHVLERAGFYEAGHYAGEVLFRFGQAPEQS